MARIDDPSKGEMAALLARVRDLERATPLNNASIGRNGLRVHSGGVITIQNGGLSITGTAEVIGQLIGSGVLTWTGPVNFEGETTMTGDTTFVGRVDVTGPMYVSGATDFNGSLDITGATRIQGETTLEDDLTVTSGGKITVGNMKIGEGTHGSGKGVSFTNGGALSATSDRVEIYAATNGLITAGTSESALYLGANGVIVTGSGIKLSGLSLDTGKTPNVHIDGTGRLWRTS